MRLGAGSAADFGFGAAARFGAGTGFAALRCFRAAATCATATDLGLGRVARRAAFDAAFDGFVRTALGATALARDVVRRGALALALAFALTLDLALIRDVFLRDALARTFAPTALRELTACGALPFAAARATLAFFRACLAAFLLAFATFRARLSSAFASRTCCFAVSARALAFLASAPSRCAAADCFVRTWEVATIRSLAQQRWAVSLVLQNQPVTLAAVRA